MSLLVQQDLTAIGLVVFLTDDNTPHPTEGGYIIDMTIDSCLSAFVCPQTTATNDLINLEQLPKADKKRQNNTYYVYDSQNA